MHYKDSDVTAHSVEQEREETSEIISEHVSVPFTGEHVSVPFTGEHVSVPFYH